MKYFIILLVVLSFPLKASSQLSMPIGGEQNKDWWVWSYFDNDTTVGSASNFKCSSYVYDNWFGLVFVLKNLQLMDKGIPVLAAANGQVISTRDGYIDRTKRTDSGGRGNFIRIQHNPTLYTLYSDLRNHSLKVKNGDVVKKGDTIAYVGSSGNVYFAKLYFRVEGSDGGNFIDPLGYQCGSSPYPPLLKPGPIYDTTFGLLDFGITNHAQYTDDTLMERPPTISEISVTNDDYACAWLQYKNVFTGDNIERIWINPKGNTFSDKQDPSPSDYHFGYFRTFYPTYQLDTGIWTVKFLFNGDSLCQLKFHVVQAHSGVAQSTPIIQPITFPQPSKDHATFNGIVAKEAHLYDIEGIEHPIRFDNYSEGVTISWQNLPKGVYYLSIKDEKGILHRAKIMVSP